jgi:predicted dehydrogenase
LSKLKVLLLGGGWIAQTVYVPFLSELDSVEEIQVCDLDPKAVAQRFAEWPKVKAVAAPSAASGRFDIACVLTPNHRHLTDVLGLLGRVGKLLVEKPLCIGREQARHLAAAIRECGTPVHVSAPLRYRPDLAALKADVVSKHLGRIYGAEVSWFKRKGTPGSPWFTDRKLAGGGVLMDMGPHLLDLSYWLFGRERSAGCTAFCSDRFFNTGNVYADWHQGQPQQQGRSDVEDTALAFLRYPERSLYLSLAWVSQVEKDDARLRIFGTEGMLEVHTAFGFSTQTLHSATRVHLSTAEGCTTSTLEIGDRRAPFRPMLKDFVESDRCQLPDAEDALAVVEELADLYAASGREA